MQLTDVNKWNLIVKYYQSDITQNNILLLLS